MEHWQVHTMLIQEYEKQEEKGVYPIFKWKQSSNLLCPDFKIFQIRIILNCKLWHAGFIHRRKYYWSWLSLKTKKSHSFSSLIITDSGLPQVSLTVECPLVTLTGNIPWIILKTDSNVASPTSCWFCRNFIDSTWTLFSSFSCFWSSWKRHRTTWFKWFCYFELSVWICFCASTLVINIIISLSLATSTSSGLKEQQLYSEFLTELLTLDYQYNLDCAERHMVSSNVVQGRSTEQGGV